MHPVDELMRAHANSHNANQASQITYLNSVVMPDEDSSDSSENDDEGDGDSDAENDSGS